MTELTLKDLTPEAQAAAEKFAKASGKSISDALSELVVLGAAEATGDSQDDCSPESRLEKIRALREDFGPVDFDIVEAIREIREDG